MNRLLLLGGTTEALGIARTLTPPHIYSLAGVSGVVPNDLACHVRVGGFGGEQGLLQFIREQGITLIVDATHPFAVQISRHAVTAAQYAGIPCWRLQRPTWAAKSQDDWHIVKPDWQEISSVIKGYKRPFFTLGRQPLAHVQCIPDPQHWFIRCLHPHPSSLHFTVIPSRGPFDLQSERALFEKFDFDIVVTKNSGSIATEPKLEVAREKQISVIMLSRPELPSAERSFCDPGDLIHSLYSQNAL